MDGMTKLVLPPVPIGTIVTIYNGKDILRQVLDTTSVAVYAQRVMFLNDEERRRVEDKALEQILKMAHLARIDPQELGLVVASTWPFPLTEDDRAYLRSIFVDADA